MYQSKGLRKGLVKGFVTGILVAATVACQPALAQEKKLVLKVLDYLPVDHFISRYATKPWMEQVTQKTGGLVQFEYYPAEQLGKAKDLFSLVQSGVGDFAIIVPSYNSDKMPLTAAIELPSMFSDACQASQTFWKLANDGGILAQREYAPNGLRTLFTFALPSYQLLSAKRKLESLKDIEGMKVRVLAGAMELATQKLKAVGVRMVTPDLFEALNRGTVDGAMFSYSGILTYKFPVKYVTAGAGFGGPAVTFAVSEKRWKQLPDSVQKAMMDAGQTAIRSACTGMDKDAVTDLEKLERQGVTVVRWSAADKQKVDAVMSSVAKEWAAELDKRGKPGSEVLNALIKARDGR